MPQQPPTILPRHHGLNYGLHVGRGKWYARWRVDKHVKTRQLAATNVAQAREERDAIYVELVAQGAVVKGTAEEIHLSERYIYREAPFIVRVQGKLIGRFETEAEAREARDQYLNTSNK